MNKLVYGIGVNDSDYVVQIKQIIDRRENGRIIQKVVWVCPFYRKWSSMLMRCYSDKCHEKQPTYIGCRTVPEWHYFMNFRAWMVKQDWEGKQLDKDLLVSGNKTYGPDTCVFLDQKLNKFLAESTASRGEWPLGVTFEGRPGRERYKARCQDSLQGGTKSLGFFDTAEQAHNAWLTEKLRQARILATQQSDPRVAKALIERYENYGKS